MRSSLGGWLLILAGSAVAAGVPRSFAPADARVYFISPRDGDIVTGPVAVQFGLKGMGIAPAGVAMDGTGHHHLLIDVQPPAFDGPVPADAQHLHFGRGQTETIVVLAPGVHRLQLLLGDHLHMPHDPPVMSEPITVVVR